MKRLPNPICKCGHRRDRHGFRISGFRISGRADAPMISGCDVQKCGCRRFVKRPTKHALLIAATDYEALAERQGGESCAICQAQPKGKRRLDIDHCHRKLYVRGLLCARCNRALPYWVTPRWLRDAAEYLERAEEERAEVVREKAA